MEGPPLGPGGEDITWPDKVAPRGRKASSTRKIKPQTSNHGQRGQARSGGESHTGTFTRSGEGPTTAHTSISPSRRKQGPTTTRHQHTTHAHTHTHTNTTGRHIHTRTTTNTDTTNTQHAHQRRHHVHASLHKHIQHGKTPKLTPRKQPPPRPAEPSQERWGTAPEIHG